MNDPVNPAPLALAPLDTTGSGGSFSILFAKNPAMLDFSLAVSNGSCPDLQEPFTYCELGVGTGNSILNYAAAFPYAHFYGLDTQTDHLVGLMDRAKRGGVENLTAQAFSLEDLPDLAAGLPPMDFCRRAPALQPHLSGTATAIASLSRQEDPEAWRRRDGEL